MTKKYIIATLLVMVFMALSIVLVSAQEMYPQIRSVSPENNEMSVSTLENIQVEFTQDMDASTINSDTFIVMQQTTPVTGTSESRMISGTVRYENRIATFTPDERYIPNQEYGNVFTGRITTGAADQQGNSLTQDYVWSFTLGENPFFTDSGTTQQNQTATLVPGLDRPEMNETNNRNETAVVPVTTDEVQNWLASPFFWVPLGLLLGLLLLYLLLSNRDRNKTTRKDSFAGSSYPVEAIEGIGQTYSGRLHVEGIHTTKELWEADAVAVANKIRAPTKSVMHWQHMAELASIKSIGPQYAELLDRSGIHSIKELQSQTPNKLLRAVQDKENSVNVNIQGNIIGRETVKNWIHEARNYEGEAVPVVRAVANKVLQAMENYDGPVQLAKIELEQISLAQYSV